MGTTAGKGAAAAPAPAVEFAGVAKAFGPCVANRDVTFAVAGGTIHAIVGENGAGKSTAMKMLYGLYRPDSGSIRVNGRPLAARSPRDAIAAGIGMVHQHFMLAEPVSGLDNILLGAEPERRGVWRFLPGFLRPIDRDGARARLRELLRGDHFGQGQTLDLEAPVNTLPVGMQQRLEILKLLYRDVGILILDEPTAVLTPQEVAELFVNLKRLKAAGRTIIIITHKLHEVLDHADAVTVLRRGAVVGTRPVAGATEAQLAELMVGRAVQLTVAAPPPPRPGAEALRLSGVTLTRPEGGKPRLSALDLTVRHGEIVGIAGVEGNGQSDLLRLVTNPASAFGGRGRQRATGELAILGQDARRLNARAVRDRGVGHIPEDRHHQGLVLEFSLLDNFLLGRQHRTPYARRGFIDRSAALDRLDRASRTFDIRPALPEALAGGLSGGNQQKLIIAREFDSEPRLLICAQPTRGVDVGSIEFIHSRIMAARAAGCGVLLVSSALEEIMALSDRIHVMFEGAVNATFARGEADQQLIGRYMGGGDRAPGRSGA